MSRRVIAAPAGPASWLNARRRDAELDQLAGGAVIDLLVVGGGVTGAGVALDAVTRGLTVALLERHDLAAGTSAFSSKLAHGGLRYLARGQIDVAWESAVERHILATRTAPHLIRSLPQLTPIYRGFGERAEAETIAVGIRGGDLMRAAAGTRKASLPRMRHVSAAEARLWAPAVAAAGLRGALLAWDCQLEDDARLVVALARTAAAYGAKILTRCEVTELGPGGATVRDTVHGSSFQLRARHVINATGVWAGALAAGVRVQPSRGSHLIVDGARLGQPRAMVNVPVPGHFGRFVFAIPRPDGTVLIGLTDEPVEGPLPGCPSVPAADREFLLRSVSRVFAAPLAGEDVIGEFAGFRPLLGAAGTTADISRRHAVIEDPDTGAVTVVGGKLTTYRRMAQDAVDVVAARPGVNAGRCRTRALALVGAGRSANAASPPGLARRFGDEAAAIAALAEDRPGLLEPLVEGSDVLGVELVAAVQREGALSVADVLDRRSRLGLVPARRSAALARGGELIATELAQQGIRDDRVELAAGTLA